jgi:type I restriction enzyme, S subunit
VIDTATLPSVPASWDWERASNVCLKIQDGTHFSPKNQQPQGLYKYITAKNIRPWGMDLNDITYLDERDHRTIYERCGPKKGDVLLVKDGVNTGDAALNTLDEEFSMLSSVCLLRPDKRVIDGAFLRYFLQSPVGYQSLTGQMSGTAIRRIVLHRIRDLPVPVAPLPEQRRIVAEIETQFTRLDAAVAALERARVNLKRYRAAVLASAVSSGFVPVVANVREIRATTEPQANLPPEGHQLPCLPPDWKWAVVGDLLSSIQAGRSFRCEERPPNADEVGVVKVSAVTWGEYDEMQSKTCIDTTRHDQSLLIGQGDFLFSRANTIELVGACVIAKNVTLPVMLSDKILRFTFKEIDQRWVLYYLRSMWGRLEIQRLATGNQESMRNIGQDRIRRIRIPIAPADQVEVILQEVERCLSVADQIEVTINANLKRADRLRQSILRKAFSGQLVPQDSNDEPACALLERIRDERTVSAVTKPRRTRSPDRTDRSAAVHQSLL